MLFAVLALYIDDYSVDIHVLVPDWTAQISQNPELFLGPPNCLFAQTRTLRV